MTAPVDVMAVVNRMVGQARAYRAKSRAHGDDGRTDEYAEDCEARAAMAELIRAQRKAHDAMLLADWNMPHASQRKRDAFNASVAALVRIGGAR